MWARFALALLALQLPSLRAFDFDDEEVVDAPSQGGGDFFGGADAGEGFQVAVTEQLGNAEPRVRGHLYVRPSTMMGGTTGGRVTLRTSQFKLDAEGIDALKAVAAEGGFYTLSMPSVLKDPTSTPVFTSASACALLASRFEEHLQLTMTSTKDRVLALSYTLPVVPESCPGTTPLPRLALDEVIFNTTAVMHFPDEGAKPMGKIHDAAFLPPAAAQAAARAQQQSGMGPGGMPGPNGISRPVRFATLEDSSSGFGANVRGLGHNNYLGKILNSRVYDIAIETPLQRAPILSTQLNNTVYLKREDLQPVFSFKIRGAYNKIAQLSREQQLAGIVACSAGNHAQGVAMSAAHLGIDAIIVMPTGTPAIKVDAVRKLRGNVKLHGSNYDEAQAEAMRLVETEGRTLIHPFDDPLVIAGQGTIGAEVLKHMTGKPLHAIFVCCGGGGMLAGIAAYIKRVRPGVLVIGVEAEDAAGMTASLRNGELTQLETVGLFADGAAVRTVGAETFRICNELVDDMVTVTTDEICAAIKDGFMETRCVLEPAGALGIAGMKKWVASTGVRDQTFVGIASGANMDFDRLRFVSERADSSETMLSVLIPERPGSFRSLVSLIEPRNVTELSYRMGQHERAAIYLSFQARGPSAPDRLGDAEKVVTQLRGAGMSVKDLKDNELAKAHLRHLGGGRGGTPDDSSGVPNEHLIRFEFPERPGALSHFLDQLAATGWNCSLFQYRNHGADIGRVLTGLQVPPDEFGKLSTFLESVGYRYELEDDNEVRKHFL